MGCEAILCRNLATPRYLTLFPTTRYFRCTRPSSLVWETHRVPSFELKLPRLPSTQLPTTTTNTTSHGYQHGGCWQRATSKGSATRYVVFADLNGTGKVSRGFCSCS